MLMPQHEGGVNSYAPNPQAGSLTTRTQWLREVLFSGRVTGVAQHIALAIFYEAYDTGTANLSARDIDRITGWSASTIAENIGSLGELFDIDIGKGRAKSTFTIKAIPCSEPFWNLRVPLHEDDPDHPERVRKSIKRLERAVWMKTNGHCTYCDVHLDPFNRQSPNGFHMDHTIPHSRGGPCEIENLVPACSKCNLEKKARTPEEWRASSV
jgi:hypothetical protein